MSQRINQKNQPPAPAYLKSPAGETIELGPSSITFGRAAENQVVLNSTKASRHHALIYYAAGQYFIRDLGSKNGTRVNGERVASEQILQSGDRIKIGDVAYFFQAGSADDYTETASLSGVQFHLPAGSPSPIEIDLEAMQVKMQGRLVSPPLSPLEWKLLVLLYQNQGKVCTRDMLFETLYNLEDPSNFPLDTALETLVSRLRKRLGISDANRLPYIRAVRGAGYRLEL